MITKKTKKKKLAFPQQGLHMVTKFYILGLSYSFVRNQKLGEFVVVWVEEDVEGEFE